MSQEQGNKPDNKGLRRILHATRYSLQGLRAALQHEAAFRQELLLFCLLLPPALWFGKSGTERALLVASLLLILIVELLNSAIEAVVDRIGPELHILAGRAKDIGSAAVFIALLNAAVVWLLILFT